MKLYNLKVLKAYQDKSYPQQYKLNRFYVNEKDLEVYGSLMLYLKIQKYSPYYTPVINLGYIQRINSQVIITDLYMLKYEEI